MRLLGQPALVDGARKHADAKNALSAWGSLARAAQWNSFVELRADIPSADYVAPFTVFNIRGNKYRLICVVDYREKIVIVRAFLTHAEYDKEGWK